MKNQPTSQPQAWFNQLRHHKLNLPQHEKKGKKRKHPYTTDQSQASTDQFKKGTMP